MILIIEDEPALASALATVCRRLGYDAETCASGHAGLERLPAAQLAILDIGLPDISGLDVLEKARAQAPNIPVIIITAHGNLENAVAARKLGAAAYLVKPLDLREVQQTIKQRKGFIMGHMFLRLRARNIRQDEKWRIRH